MSGIAPGSGSKAGPAGTRSRVRLALFWGVLVVLGILAALLVWGPTGGVGLLGTRDGQMPVLLLGVILIVAGVWILLRRPIVGAKKTAAPLPARPWAPQSGLAGPTPKATPAAGRSGKRITHLLILLESEPVGGAAYFTQQLAANLYDGATGRPYGDFMDSDTKVHLKVVGSQNFDDQYLLMATLTLTWGPMESTAITHQRFHGRGGNGTTVEVWSQP